jgi:hypothetical protein
MKEVNMDNISFFKGIRQSTVKMGAYDINMPIFYRAMSGLGVYILAPISEIKSFLPSGRMHPFRVTPWHCIITITASEYKETDIGSYNQVSIGVPFMLDRISPVMTGILHKPPEHPMIYMLYLPVTTETARVTGLEMANYPEFLADISFNRGDQWTSCTVDAEGKNILTLAGRKISLKPSLRERVYPITLQQDRLLRSEFNLSECESGISKKKSDVQLEFGNHPIGSKLKELNLGRVLAYQYWPLRQAALSMVCESYPI